MCIYTNFALHLFFTILLDVLAMDAKELTVP